MQACDSAVSHHDRAAKLSPTEGEQLIDAIAFNVDREVWPCQATERVEIAYRLDVNEFRGQRSLQLMIEQLLPA